jgi:hypothetical protein
MRFLRELRQLRNDAGLEPTELAARAHYPQDVIVAAEAGPSLPDLPVLSAYVRGCGGGLTEWEERWRSLTGSPTAAICLPARPVGCSSLASAGARAPVAPAADVDARRIMAAITKASVAYAAAAIPSQAKALPPLEPGPPPPSPRVTASCDPSEPAAIPVALIQNDSVSPVAPTAHPAGPPATSATGARPGRPLAIRTLSRLAGRQPNFSRATIAATVAAVVLAVGAIIMLLLRKG